MGMAHSWSLGSSSSWKVLTREARDFPAPRQESFGCKEEGKAVDIEEADVLAGIDGGMAEAETAEESGAGGTSGEGCSSFSYAAAVSAIKSSNMGSVGSS